MQQCFFDVGLRHGKFSNKQTGANNARIPHS